MSIRVSEHIKQYPPATLDSATLRGIRDILAKELTDIEQERDSMPDPTQLKAFNEIFGEEIAEWKNALQKIEDELALRQ